MVKIRIPQYGRVKFPPSMRLTERDKHILQAIHAYDGMLGFSQIQRMYFTGKSQTEQRMKLLYQNGYVNRPDKEQRRRIPEMVYWLDKKGAALVSSLLGTTISEMGWRKQPRWFQVEHDLAVNDFRLDLVAACHSNPNVTLETWVPESEFWAYPDKITYFYAEREKKRNIRPDGYFTLIIGDDRIRYLLEIDRSTEDNPRFLREKILPGLAYIRSRAYEQRFGHKAGRWLVVTTSERRMANMLDQARRAEAKGSFYFTTYEQLTPERMLLAPIWRRVDRDVSVPLLYID